MEKSLIKLSHVTKSFSVAAGMFQALKDVNIEISENEMIAITGKSGSGKSTLLNILTGIDKPSSGSVTINGVHVDKLSESELASWRGKNSRHTAARSHRLKCVRRGPRSDRRRAAHFERAWIE